MNAFLSDRVRSLVSLPFRDPSVACTVDFLLLLPGNDSVGEDENLPAQSSSSSDEASTRTPEMSSGL